MILKAHTYSNKRKVIAAGLTDTGRRRPSNQDSFLIKRTKGNQLCCVVADGMGGQDYGELASRIVIEAVNQQVGDLPGTDSVLQWLITTVEKAQQEVRSQLDRLQPHNGMGSTLVAGVFNDSTCYVANVGDSRAYLLREGSIQRLTKDHSLMEMMIDRGLIKPDEAYTHPRRGEITQFIGQQREVKVDLYQLEIRSGDTLLFCSDGLWEMLRDGDIEALLAKHPQPDEATALLINRANQCGGVDNITAVVARVV